MIGGIAFAINSDIATDDDTLAVISSKTDFESSTQESVVEDALKREPSGIEDTLIDESVSFKSKDIDGETAVNGTGSNGAINDPNTPISEEPIRTGLDGLNRKADIIYIDYYVSGYPHRVMDSHAKALALELLDVIEYRSHEKPTVNGEEVAGFIAVDMIVETDKGPLEIEFSSAGSEWNMAVIFRSNDPWTTYVAPGYYHDILQELLMYLQSS
jgi:hypothetical protein